MNNNDNAKKYEELKDTKTINEWTKKKHDLGIRIADWAVQDKYDSDKDYDHRTVFQHDIGRIIHSKAFRRLKHKTQVFISYEKDHYRTRLTHVMEVFQIATSIARTLALNEDLSAAIALGHDLGHTPFGHSGEYTLDNIMCGRNKEVINIIDGDEKEIKDKLNERYNKYGFGYKHNYESVKIFNKEKLKISAETREGILKHTKWLKSIRHASTDPSKLGNQFLEDYNLKDIQDKLGSMPYMEAQVVAWCDEIAQRCHDLDDGVRSGLITLRNSNLAEIIKPLRNINKDYINNFIENYDKAVKAEINENEDKNEYLPEVIRGLVNFFVSDLLDASLSEIKRGAANKADYFRKNIPDTIKDDKGIESPELGYFTIHFTADVYGFMNKLQDILNISVYHSSPSTVREERAKYFIVSMFKAYLSNPLSMPNATLLKYISTTKELQRIRNLKTDETEEYFRGLRKDLRFWELICDHISGMTDDYAQDRFERLFTPFKMVTND
jgi:dGTPase